MGLPWTPYRNENSEGDEGKCCTNEYNLKLIFRYLYQKDPRMLPPHAIRNAAKAVANREIRTQREEFQELGIMADWSEEGTYRTLGAILPE